MFQVFFVSVVRKGEYLTHVMQSSSLDKYYLKTYIPDNRSLHPKHKICGYIRLRLSKTVLTHKMWVCACTCVPVF
jgi:hypothetical protein